VQLSGTVSSTCAIVRVRRRAAVVAAAVLVAVAAGRLLVPAAGAEPDDADAYLDRDATVVRVNLHRSAKHWALKGMVLLSLGPRWHPAGAPMIVAALEDKDERHRVYALEALAATDPVFLRRLASRDVVAALVRAQATSGNDVFDTRAREVLTRIAPAAMAQSRDEWISWWRQIGGAYEPARWIEPARPESDGVRRTVALPFLRRAFDLQDAPLEVAICIDTTGSMQRAIDEARDAVDDVVTVLDAVSPGFRLGLVHYRDDGDLDTGADMLQPLTRKGASVKRKLGGLQAGGGGDYPERVDRALELALSRRMRWTRAANKLVILVGDAPPKDEAKAIELARAAHEDGLDLGPATGSAKPPRPIVISAITVGAVAGLDRVVRAGGGSVSRLRLGRGRGAAGGAAAGGVGAGASGGGVAPGSQVVKQVLALAFGERWAPQLDVFLEIFFRYRAAGFFD
jgi:hypothetical protein